MKDGSDEQGHQMIPLHLITCEVLDIVEITRQYPS